MERKGNGQEPVGEDSGPLAGLRVVDLTHMLAGPYCTWLLGGLGAEVIKVEMPGRGDSSRGVAPFLNGESIYFLSVNRNKRGLTLTLKRDRGREIFRRLVGTADVLVENYRPGVIDRLGLGYPELATLNPRLVYASISGFGQSGPYGSKPAYDLVAQALSGMMSVTGEPGGPPARVGVSIGDLAASLFATVGILAALHDRTHSGRGTYIDVSMLDCQIALLENAVARYLNAGELAQRLGSRHPLIAPFQAFPTADDPVVVRVDGEEQWGRFCRAVGLDALLDDPRFADAVARVRQRAELEPILVDVFRRKGRREWLEILEAADVPGGPINTIADALQSPQVVARQMIREVEVPPGGKARFAGLPIQMLSHASARETPPPRIGEHTVSILGELGFSREETVRFRTEGVI